jgi:hypothetical protein
MLIRVDNPSPSDGRTASSSTDRGESDEKGLSMSRIHPATLTWAEVDPSRHAFDATVVHDVVRSVVPRPSATLSFDDGGIYNNSEAEQWRDAAGRALVECYGPWASGWNWGRGEGDHDGGPLGTWCCPQHSISSPDATLLKVADSLIEWRRWLESLAVVFADVVPRLDPGQAPDELTRAWQRAVGRVVRMVAARTKAESGWYGHCHQVIGWLLTVAAIPEDRHDQLISEAIGGRFESWIQPEPRLVNEIADELARRLSGQPEPAEPLDALAAWLSVRAKINWSAVSGPVRQDLTGDSDAIDAYFSAHHKDWFELSQALDQVRLAVSANETLTFALVSTWQRRVLDVPEALFRTGTAWAKRGRERYDRPTDLPQIFEQCLAEATDPGLPLPSRAARVYLDVAFFHPFDDGNARSAALALYFVLAREGIVLDRAAPILDTVRLADDEEGAAGLATLIESLINDMRLPPTRPASAGDLGGDGLAGKD